MRRVIATAALPLLLSALTLAADPVKPVRFPEVPVRPADPPPSPDAVPVLDAGVWYVIDSDVPLLVLASPAGLVSVSADEGPVRVRGRFIDGTGKNETRTYKGKHVYTVEAVKSGRVELLVVPVGAAAEKDVVRKTIDVRAGEGPLPPPNPDPKPPPGPQGKPAAFLIVEETGSADGTRGRLFGDAKLQQFVAAGRIVSRVVDKDAVDKDGNPPKDAAPYLQRVRDKGMKLPALFVVSADGSVLFAGDYTDPTDLLKKLGG